MQPHLATAPFRWAGGKRRLAPMILSLFPPAAPKSRYLEPFLGGGAVFWHLAPKQALLADTNQDLIACWHMLKKRPEALLSQLIAIHEATQSTCAEDYYYEIRAQAPTTILGKAARFLYLQANSFNGLWRENATGQMNTPWGKYSPPRLPNLDRLRACAKRLQPETISICTAPFPVTLEQARAGDHVYADPPYTPLTPSASFQTYQANGFGPEAHQELASWCGKLKSRGVYLIVSNHDLPETRALYQGHRILPIQAARNIACKSASRAPVGELLVLNW